MASHGWMINLSGKSIPVYSIAGGGPSTTKIGNLTKNECFVEGTFSANPWEGDDAPVFFLNSNHQMTFGLLADYENNLVDFTDYASNGTAGATHSNYIAVTSVQTASGKKYDFDGNGFIDLTYGNRWVNVGSILLRKA